MAADLTNGAVWNLVQSEGTSANPGFPASVVQVLRVIKVNGSSNNNQDRYRVILSDGQNFVQGMLATQLNHLVTNNQIVDYALIRVNDYMNNLVQNKNVIILLAVDVVNAQYGQKIGNPSDIEADPSAKAGAGAGPGGAQPLYNTTNAAGGQQQNAYVKPEPSSSGGMGMAGGNPYGGGGMNRGGGAGSGGSAPIVRNTTSSGQNIIPIAQLNLYMNRWAIRARVTSKTDIKHWSNARGEGSLFSVELLDSSGTDIRATFFKEGVDKFYNMIETDKVYTFSGGRLKVANMQYNTCKSQCEINFDQNSEIHLDNDTGDNQQQLYDFVKIADLESIEPNSYVDVIGVVKVVGDVATIISKKSGNELLKCELTLADDSGAEVSCTIWGERATRAAQDYANQPIIAMRRCRVGDYGGRSLSAGQAISVMPRIPDTQRLQNWWQSGGSTTAARTLTSGGGGGSTRVPTFEERKTISAIKAEHLGMNPDKPDWISFKGRFNFLKKDKEGGAWYPACANSGEPCKNRYKVTQTADGNWHCERCQQVNPTCVRRFIFSATVADDTCTTWASLFDEQAVQLLGVTADDLYRDCFEQNQDEERYNGTFDVNNFKEYIFTCKVKQEFVNDEARVKTSIHRMFPVDYVEESRKLLEQLAVM